MKIVPFNDDRPLVSVISFCKDRSSTICRSIDSVLSQSYFNIEFVVQDGASTDGTLEILKSYDDPRLKIISEEDSGPAEGFWKVLNRCQGEIIATCLSDEELLPGALEKAVDYFKANEHVGALTCDGYVTDMEGNIVDEFNAGEFNLVDYLFGWYCPFWPGSFFRRQALIDVGLNSHNWTMECLEFEIWCRLGTRHVVKHVPWRISKYAVHDTQLSNTKHYFNEHFDNRAKVIDRMFSEAGVFGQDKIKKMVCHYNQLYLLYNHVKAYKLHDQTEMLAGRLLGLLRNIGLVDRVKFNEYLFSNNSKLILDVRKTVGIYNRANGIWLRFALSFSDGFRKKVPRFLRLNFREFVRFCLVFIFTLMHFTSKLLTREGQIFGRKGEEIHTPNFNPKLYDEIAQIYYSRGQIDEALQLWRSSGVLKDQYIDSTAAQAMLMSPTATYADLTEIQVRWADRHAKPFIELGPCPTIPYQGDRKIKVAYFCAWFDSMTFKAILGKVIESADRKKFEVYAYSTSPVPPDVSRLFDHLRVTGKLSNAEFIRQVRADRIDICIEITGFSPFNRFAALATRCAPIQVSYLNHTGTSAVPNVDYIFADEISVPPEHDLHFTEKVWRLPGCFLSYDYNLSEMPAIVQPPCIERGYVTFGCFGSGGKIGLQLIQLWAKVLHRVPGSRMFIRNNQLTATDNSEYMVSRFERFGIEPSRLTILGGADREKILKCYDDVDVSLDTWPYCGGNTIAESLWQGVPVITLKAGRFSGRYGASLLTAAGCGELIANSNEEYMEIAAALAGSPDRLQDYRFSLRDMVRVHGLSDSKGFANKLEDAYLLMMQELHKKKI